MTNEEKLEFIKRSYIYSRATELLPDTDVEKMNQKWITEMLPKIPVRLYKYRACSENNLAMIRNKTAWFSCPTTWNDPIDVTVSYDKEKDLYLLQEHIDRIVMKTAFSLINQYIDSFCEQKKFVTADRVKKVYYNAFEGGKKVNFSRIISSLTPVVGEKPARQIAVKTQEAFLTAQQMGFREKYLSNFESLMTFNNIREEMLMYSLSESYDNNHQWAVYADEGKGFCIGYFIRPKSYREASLIRNLLPIYYGQKEPLMITRYLDETLTYTMRNETLDELGNQESAKLYASLYIKTPEWIGEQEWRFSIPKHQAESNAIPFDFYECIYLGENIEDGWKEKLMRIAKDQGLKVYQRGLDNTKSKWVYTEIVLQ